MSKAFTAVLVLFLSGAALASTTITYQGQLRDSSGPFNGDVALEFELYATNEGGPPLADSIPASLTPVSAGLFQVELDFGPDAFDGTPRWLQITVNGQVLESRQLITAAPLALYALSGNEGPAGPPGETAIIATTNLTLSGSGSTEDPYIIGALINTATQAGLVEPGETFPNRVWKTDALGNPGWRAASDSEGPDCNYEVGPASSLGGYIVYVTPNGCHGLVVTSQDQGDFEWGVSDAACTNPVNHDAEGQNYVDWRLPNLWELQSLICPQAENIGGFSLVDYWSSSTSGNSGERQYRVNFAGCSASHGSNANTARRIRCIRSF